MSSSGHITYVSEYVSAFVQAMGEDGRQVLSVTSAKLCNAKNTGHPPRVCDVGNLAEMSKQTGITCAVCLYVALTERAPSNEEHARLMAAQRKGSVARDGVLKIASGR